MPTVRILQSVAGLDFSWVPGDEIDMTEEQAAAWADNYRGELVEAEKAVKPRAEAPERAPEIPEAKAEQPVRRGPGRPRKP